MKMKNVVIASTVLSILASTGCMSNANEANTVKRSGKSYTSNVNAIADRGYNKVSRGLDGNENNVTYKGRNLSSNIRNVRGKSRYSQGINNAKTNRAIANSRYDAKKNYEDSSTQMNPYNDTSQYEVTKNVPNMKKSSNRGTQVVDTNNNVITELDSNINSIAVLPNKKTTRNSNNLITDSGVNGKVDTNAISKNDMPRTKSEIMRNGRDRTRNMSNLPLQRNSYNENSLTNGYTRDYDSYNSNYNRNYANNMDNAQANYNYSNRSSGLVDTTLDRTNLSKNKIVSKPYNNSIDLKANIDDDYNRDYYSANISRDSLLNKDKMPVKNAKTNSKNNKVFVNTDSEKILINKL
jgi:hypothetical protein